MSANSSNPGSVRSVEYALGGEEATRKTASRTTGSGASTPNKRASRVSPCHQQSSAWLNEFYMDGSSNGGGYQSSPHPAMPLNAVRNATAPNSLNTSTVVKTMLSHMHRTGLREQWLHEDDEEEHECVVMLTDDAILAHPPSTQPQQHDWLKTLLLTLHATCAVVAKPNGVDALLSHMPLHRSITLETGEEIAIVDDLTQVALLAPAAGCMLLRQSGLAVSYGSAVSVLHVARQLDTALVSALYMYTVSLGQTPATAVEQQSDTGGSTEQQQQPLPDQQQREWLSMLESNGSNQEAESLPSSSEVNEKGNDLSPKPVVLVDSETGEAVLEPERSSAHFAALLTGLGVAINMVIMALFARDIVLNTLADGDYMRAVLLVAIVPRFFVAQYFCDHVVLIVAQLLFPVSQMHRNSLYYSGAPSAPLAPQHKLPHFTVHMPCYKEGLRSVLAPSLKSVLAAVHAYRAQGGTANVIISEDGLRLLSKQEAEERVRFYNANGCSWVARPADGEQGYQRLGRFKKASNLNFTYTLSLRLEEVMEQLAAERQYDDDAGETLYDDALQRVLAESDGRAWATGNIRIGDYILLIDSDTRVPEDCLMQAAAEMERSPDVGALQHCSGITYVQHHYFERLLGYFVGVFTNFSISWVCSNGAMAPLMGHNVFLRWTALQHVADQRLLHDERQIFSSEHVSEDYELAMRLQMAGYCVRWATYSDQAFREGVSLNPTDEKARWQKYAFGACEILFHPFVRWYKGPFTGLFWRFMWSSNVRTAGKLSMLSYLFSYFALGVALPLTVLMTVIQGLFWPTLDTSFKPIFDTWISVIVVFNLAGAIGLVTVRARAGHSTLLQSLWEGAKHLPAIVVFFSGITYHITAAILAYFFSVRMIWQATSKDFQQTSIQQVIRRFWHCYLTMTLLLVAAIVAVTPLVPSGWRIGTFTILFPLFLAIVMHFLFPILLDPGILHKFLPRYYASKAKAVEPSRSFFHGANAQGAMQGQFRMAFDDEKDDGGAMVKSPPSSVFTASSSFDSFGMPRPSPLVPALGYSPQQQQHAHHHSLYTSPAASLHRMPSYFHTRTGWQGARPGNATPGLASSVTTHSVLSV